MFAAFFAIASNSLAAEFDFEVGHWVGKSEWSSGGHFESCMVSEHNDKNEILIIRLDRKRELTIGLFEKKWRASTQLPLELLVMIDHTPIYSGIGWLHASDALLIALEPSDATLLRVRSGKFLLVSSGDEVMTFGLKDSDKAVEFLTNCLQQSLRTHKNI